MLSHSIKHNQSISVCSSTCAQKRVEFFFVVIFDTNQVWTLYYMRAYVYIIISFCCVASLLQFNSTYSIRVSCVAFLQFFGAIWRGEKNECINAFILTMLDNEIEWALNGNKLFNNEGKLSQSNEWFCVFLAIFFRAINLEQRTATKTIQIQVSFFLYLLHWTNFSWQRSRKSTFKIFLNFVWSLSIQYNQF